MNKYGFYDRLTEQFPSQIVVDLCNVCNYECIHCPQSQYKKSDAFTGTYLSEEINKKLVDEAANDGAGMIQQIRYTAAGEPLLHPKAIDMLRYAVENSKTMVTLTTNGSLLTDEMSDELLDMNIGLIDFSLDAFKDETYAQIRKKGDLKIVRERILDMLNKKKLKNSKTRIIVSFVEQEKNTSEKDEFKKYWEEHGIDFVVIRKCHSAGGFFYKENNKKRWIQPCVYPWERVAMDAKGNLSFCPASWLGKTVICRDYSKTTIKEVWNNKDYQQLRKEHLENKFDKYKVCEECPDRALIIWPANRTDILRGYGDMIKDFSDKEG